MAGKKTRKKATSGDPLLNAALSFRKAEVQKLWFDPLEAKSACREGLDALAPYEAKLVAEHPGLNYNQLKALPEVCDRLMGAQRAARKVQIRDGITIPSVQEALEWRRKLIPLAESLKESGAIDARELARIRAGAGPSDNVQDVRDLVGLLGPYRRSVELLHGDNALATAKEKAQAALEALGVISGKDSKSREAAELRDRYGTLVFTWHDQLRAAAAAIVGYRDAALLVPPLKEGRTPKKNEGGTTPPEKEEG
ncbi:MAG: hypothetical protein HYZ28_27900 [Myxococcales bacterium]|nr:hypothetical protein [Myxococcales bacterium]